MKRLLFLATVLIFFIWVSPSFADSPVTSTEFHTVYLDVDIVKKAAKAGVVNEEIAVYLATETNPTDIKAAVINALSWDLYGKTNTEKYVNLIYKKPLNELNLDSLSGDELLILGYLMVMDDYNQPKNALPVLEKAVNKKADSLTVSLINAIVKGQFQLDLNLPNIWKVTDEVLQNKNLQKDMRTEAVRIIVDYMSLYSEEPVLNFFSEENEMIFKIGDPDVKINGSSVEIDHGRGTTPQIKNGSTFLPISPIIKAMGGTTAWDPKERKITIMMNSQKLELWIDKKDAVVNGTPKQLSAAPYTSNSRTFLPLRFIAENLGCKVDWFSETQQISVRVPNPNYTVTAVELWSIGKNYLENYNNEKAEYYFDKSIAIDSKYANAYVGKAALLLYNEKNEEAISLSNFALSIDSQNADAYLVQGIAYRKMEKYEDSLNSCSKAVELKPDDAEAYNLRGNALYFLKRFQEAIENYDLAIKYDPTQFHPYNNKGNAFWGLGMFEDAIESYDKALEIDPFYVDTHFSKGASLYLLERASEAIQSFDQCIDLDAENAGAFYWKARALAYLGNTAEALLSLKKAIELEEEFKSLAAQDKAFKSIQHNLTFLNLTK